MNVNEFVLRKYSELVATINLDIYVAGAVPPSKNYPFAVISEVQVSERLVRPHRQWVVFGTIEVVTGSKSPIGWTTCMQLSEDVDGVINNGVQHKGNGYIMHSTYLQNSLTIPEQGDFGYVYRNIMTYIHQVSFAT